MTVGALKTDLKVVAERKPEKRKEFQKYQRCNNKDKCTASVAKLQKSVYRRAGRPTDY